MALTSPAFSIVHLGVTEEVLTQGDLVDGGQRGTRQHGIADVSCWAYAQDNYNWNRDLMTMRDMVKKLFAANKAFMIVDGYANTATPPNTPYILRIQRVAEEPTLPDPNPNVKRRRMLVYYWYFERQPA